MKTKGQIISKRFSLAEDSSKKRTKEFVFTSMQRVFVWFLEESSARKKTLREYLTSDLRYCEKTKKFETISHLFCRLLRNFKTNGIFFQICVTVSENLSFTLYLIAIERF